MEHFGIISLLPSILALTLAIWSKRVIPSLLLGILVGTIIIDTAENGFFHAILFSITNLFGAIAGHPADEEAGIYGMGLVSSPGRAEIVIVVLLLGAFIAVLNRSGGAFAFGKWLADKVKSKNGAQVSTAVMGSALFTSAYFSSLATGTVFRPIYDRMKISREKLAFFLDSTSAPINVLVPISGWVAFMGALMVDNIPSVEDPIVGLAQTIPFNFYNLLIIVFVYLLASGVIKDYGPMRKAELRAREGYEPDDLDGDPEDAYSDTDQDGAEVIRDGKASDMVVPLAVSVGLLVILGLWNYTIVNFADVPTIPFGGNQMLILSFSIGIAVAFIKYVSSKLMRPKEFLDELFEGSKSVILGGIIIILAVTLGDIMRAPAPEGTGAAGYLAEVAGDVIPAGIIPVSVFIISAFVSFSMGTSWGTWAIMMPIAISLTLATGGDPILAAAAVLSGGTFGDHTSPISDTSVMSSVGADCQHMDHINTQLPYALTAASIAAVLFLGAGFIFS
ncbi:Na+/H+ antiporter NhaC family protein [Indiicoccus explosivorum]|uniref:Na+/H+ antiporter NhaC family protein n=1 Tax=Indiicoccus explosivorum TaxID=1917864 RepID=UPI000B451F67|nr:Na+/H+ antiporter NhaC family protein [Indiicoccus explosivorum]